MAFRLRTTRNKAPNTLKRYIAPRFVEHKTTASSRETGAAATPPPADEWARPVPAAALSRSTCRCVRQLNANTTTQLRPTCSLSVSADACRRPHLPGPAKLHSTLYIYFFYTRRLHTRNARCLYACSGQDVERPLSTRRGFTTTVGSITDLDPPSTLSARARKMCPEEVRGGGWEVVDRGHRTESTHI